ncbi:MAG: hypothetical protein ABIR56_11045 [Polaromonas sp.]
MARVDCGCVYAPPAIHAMVLLLSLTGSPERVTGLAAAWPVHRMEREDTAAADRDAAPFPKAV